MALRDQECDSDALAMLLQSSEHHEVTSAVLFVGYMMPAYSIAKCLRFATTPALPMCGPMNSWHPSGESTCIVFGFFLSELWFTTFLNHYLREHGNFHQFPRISSKRLTFRNSPYTQGAAESASCTPRGSRSIRASDSTNHLSIVTSSHLGRKRLK